MTMRTFLFCAEMPALYTTSMWAGMRTVQYDMPGAAALRQRCCIGAGQGKTLERVGGTVGGGGGLKKFDVHGGENYWSVIDAGKAPAAGHAGCKASLTGSVMDFGQKPIKSRAASRIMAGIFSPQRRSTGG